MPTPKNMTLREKMFDAVINGDLPNYEAGDETLEEIIAWLLEMDPHATHFEWLAAELRGFAVYADAFDAEELSEDEGRGLGYMNGDGARDIADAIDDHRRKGGVAS